MAKDVITLVSATPPSLEDALAEYEVDLSVWEVERYVVNKWQGYRKDKAVDLDYEDGVITGTVKDSGGVNKVWMYQIKVWLQRKTPTRVAAERLLESIGTRSPKVPEIKRTKKGSYMLEVSIMDVHYGMRCWKGLADEDYNPEIAERLFLGSVEELLARAEGYDIEQILFVCGNDFLHSEPNGKTTKGVPQQEADDPQRTFERGIDLLIAAIDRLKETAPVHVPFIAGNHANDSEIHLGHVIKAYYRNDANVTVDAELSPYKVYEYGINAIFFEHGNEVPNTRLPSVFAAEYPEIWGRTTWREAHLGDQHRKGTAKPAAFEEQGVSVEFLPSLVTGNKWHKGRGFNHQKRGAMAFVWHKEHGLIVRLQVNVSGDGTLLR